MAETRLQGRPAAPGIGMGPVARLDAPRAAQRTAGTSLEEMAALEAAVAAALAELRQLAEAQQGDAADMLGFQVAMLEDDTLTEAAFAAIAAGAAADAAWQDVLDKEAALYRAGGDETFAARAADLADMAARVRHHLSGGGTAERAPQGAVLVGHDITPSGFLAADFSAGGAIALAEGSAASHVAMLARAQGVPMVVGLGPGVLALAGQVLVDGAAGTVVEGASAATAQEFSARQAALAGSEAEAAQAALQPAITACGTRVTMLVNLGDPAELARIDPKICDGVGLTRTEFLFGAGRALPDEAAQYAAYAAVLAWAGGRPVTIRTLDAGADKPIPGLSQAAESNPFLGLRGIRLSLAHPDVFRVQLRALARAAALGPLKIMLPMVALPEELEAARTMLHEEVAALARAGVAAALPPLGIMVEVPAAALALETFDAAFVSIGSNDLTQYVMAAARDIGAVAPLIDVRNPAVLRLIQMVVNTARAKNIEASLCGDAGGDPAAIPALLGCGLCVLSAAPAAIGRAKLAIAATSLAPA
jgi:phosphotransferase system enzyme I (PtsI)